MRKIFGIMLALAVPAFVGCESRAEEAREDLAEEREDQREALEEQREDMYDRKVEGLEEAAEAHGEIGAALRGDNEVEQAIEGMRAEEAMEEAIEDRSEAMQAGEPLVPQQHE
jgi:hypothetical protein